MTELTAELLVDRLDAREVAVSSDGRLVAFVVAPVGRRQEHPQSAVWLAPATMGRLQEKKRPSRPHLEGVRAQKLDASGRWWLVRDGHWWRHDARDNTWLRGDKLPTSGATRSETWALRRDELLREQNRLLAGLPPTPPGPPVVRAGDPWEPEPSR